MDEQKLYCYALRYTPDVCDDIDIEDFAGIITPISVSGIVSFEKSKKEVPHFHCIFWTPQKYSTEYAVRKNIKDKIIHKYGKPKMNIYCKIAEKEDSLASYTIKDKNYVSWNVSEEKLKFYESNSYEKVDNFGSELKKLDFNFEDSKMSIDDWLESYTALFLKYKRGINKNKTIDATRTRLFIRQPHLVKKWNNSILDIVLETQKP